MTSHRTVKGVIERCKGVQSPLAIFRTKESPVIFKVQFADTVQTKIDIKNADKTGFITTIGDGVDLDELRKLLETIE